MGEYRLAGGEQFGRRLRDLGAAKGIRESFLEPISESIFEEEATFNHGYQFEQHAESLEITQFIDAVTLK
jgi:hypothetical protein